MASAAKSANRLANVVRFRIDRSGANATELVRDILKWGGPDRRGQCARVVAQTGGSGRRSARATVSRYLLRSLSPSPVNTLTVRRSRIFIGRPY
jgi:hypothetical protein